MGILRKPGYELFAQGIAKGLPREESFIQAGYKGHPGRGSYQLIKKPLVQQRIQELMQGAASRAELSRQKILERIYDDWETARRLGQMASALKAGEMIGRELHSMFVEKKEIGGVGDFANKSEDELKKILEDGLKELGWDNISPLEPPKSIN